MKKYLFAFLLVLVFSSTSVGDEVLSIGDLKVRGWSYDLNYRIVILMPQDYVTVRNYYWDIKKYPDRDTVVAFTTVQDGKTIMYVQTRENLEPRNENIGHETKHIINMEHWKRFGVNRFPEPCKEWK